MLCASGAVQRFESTFGSRQSHKLSTIDRKDICIARLDAKLSARIAGYIVDLLVNDLSSPSRMCCGDSVVFTRYPSANFLHGKSLPPTGPPTRPGFHYSCCSKLSDNIASQIRPCGIFPVSFLYAPLDILSRLQEKHLEVIFVPDAVIPHMCSRLNALSERIYLNRLAKVLADDLAVLSIHVARIS